MSDANLSVELLPWQQNVFKDDTRFKVIAAGRRTGKSMLACWTLILKALSKDGCDVFYVAPTQAQARDILWKMLHNLAAPVIESSHINNMQVKLINGSTVHLRGADRPDNMRGVSLYYLVLDEWADQKPEVWEEVLRPALADQQGHALFIGTPKSRNHFYEIYKYAELGDDEDWKAWHFTSFDNPLIPKKEIEDAKKSMSSYAFRQEFMASFEARGSEMFKEEWMKFSPTCPFEGGEYYIAIDLAGFQETAKKKTKKSRLDNSSICVTKVSTEGWYVEDIIYGRWTLDETVRKIFQAVQDYRPVRVGIERGIAKQAVMSPLTDVMRSRNVFFNIEDLTHGNKNKTDRIMWSLQGRFEHGNIVIKSDQDWTVALMDELFQFPDNLTHDDLVDSLSYIDQLAVVTYNDFAFEDDYTPLDYESGY